MIYDGPISDINSLSEAVVSAITMFRSRFKGELESRIVTNYGLMELAIKGTDVRALRFCYNIHITNGRLTPFSSLLPPP